MNSKIKLKVERINDLNSYLFRLHIKNEGKETKNTVFCIEKNTKVYSIFSKLMFIIFLLRRSKYIHDPALIRKTADMIREEITG